MVQWLVNNEMERIQKEVVMALSRYYPGIILCCSILLHCVDLTLHSTFFAIHVQPALHIDGKKAERKVRYYPGICLED
jgi:hypothetical protein